MAKPCVIVDQGYCVPDTVPLIVVRDTAKLMDGDFVIADFEGNISFQPMCGLTDDVMVLLDGSRAPVLTMKKRTSLHGKWQVFRGASTEKNDLLFTVKRSHMVNVMTEVDVFLSHNKKEEKCDFRVKGTLYMRDCAVYAGESDIIVAEMKTHAVKIGVNFFVVEIYPNIDCAFIVSLVIILDHLIRQDRAYAGNAASIAADAADVAVNTFLTVDSVRTDAANTAADAASTAVDPADTASTAIDTADTTSTALDTADAASTALDGADTFMTIIDVLGKIFL